MNDISNTLQQRGSKYGEFADNSRVTQTVLNHIYTYANAMDVVLSYEDKEALHMVVHKMSRVVCGTGKVKDNWHDIIGYGKLARDVLSRSRLEQRDLLPISNCFIHDVMGILLTQPRVLTTYEVAAITSITSAIAILCTNSNYSFSAWQSIMDAAKVAEDITEDE